MKVFIISGCCGAGKTTLAKELQKNIPNTALISGDNIHDLIQNFSIEWETRLKIAWQNILSLLNNFLKNDINVIIDYVVEDELQQILSITDKYNVELRYIVMTADNEMIKERLISRGDSWLVERALYLRQKLISDTNNMPYIYDGAKIPFNKQLADIKQFTLYKP